MQVISLLLTRTCCFSSSPQVSHVASKFQAGVLASTASKLRSFVDEDEEEISRLNQVNMKLEQSLDETASKLAVESRAHSALRKDLDAQSKQNATYKTKISVLTEVVENLESEKARLEEGLAQVTKKWEDKTASYNALANEVEMNNFVIQEMHSELDKEGQKRVSQVGKKELELARARKESMDMEAELMSTENELRVAKGDAKKFERRAIRAETELKECQGDKEMLIGTMKSIVSEGQHSVESLDNWLKAGAGMPSDSSLATRSARRKDSIFQGTNLGGPPPPIDLSRSSDTLMVSMDDFLEVSRATPSADVTPEVQSLCDKRNFIGALVRRQQVLQARTAKLEQVNLAHCLKLQACQKEFTQQEEHWRTVNINLSKSAREESANLKKEIMKKKALLVAARKLSEGMGGKIKTLQKDGRVLKKKYDKNQAQLALSVEQMKMSEEGEGVPVRGAAKLCMCSITSSASSY